MRFLQQNMSRRFGEVTEASELKAGLTEHKLFSSANSYPAANIAILSELCMSREREKIQESIDVFESSGWTCHLAMDSERKGGGVAILTAEGIASARRQDLEPDSRTKGLDIVVATLSLPEYEDSESKQVVVASVYRSPCAASTDTAKSGAALAKWMRWLCDIKKATTRFAGVVIAGDFNVKIQSAGNIRQCAQGTALEATARQLGLELLNDGSSTRWPIGNQNGSPTALDLVYVMDTDSASPGQVSGEDFGNSFEVQRHENEALDHGAVTYAAEWPGGGNGDCTCKDTACGGGDERESCKQHREAILRSHGLTIPAINSRNFPELLTETENMEAFQLEVNQRTRELRSNPTPEAMRMDWEKGGMGNNKQLHPWSTIVDDLWRQVANSLMESANSVMGEEEDGEGNARRRLQEKLPPKARDPGQSERKQEAQKEKKGPGEEEEKKEKDKPLEQREIFWDAKCTLAKQKLRRLKRRMKSSKRKERARQSRPANPNPGSWPEEIRKLSIKLSRAKTQYMDKCNAARRRYWDKIYGTGTGKVHRLTSPTELHNLITSLSKKKKNPKGGDALATTIQTRGLTDGANTTRDLKEGASMLVEAYAATTVPSSKEELARRVATTDGRDLLGRASGEPNPGQSETNSQRYKAKTKVMEEWYAQAELTLINPQTVWEADPLPSAGYNRRFTAADIKAVLPKDRGKAVWHDGISYELMGAAPDIWLEAVATAMSLSMMTGVWPSFWKDPWMRFLVKPKGRYPEPLQCKHTRPISILSALSKVAEAAVGSRLVYNTEACDEGTGLGESQSGFRPSRGCLDNLTAKVQAIKESWQQGNFVVILQRDVNKAYDRVWTKGLLFKLYHQTKIRGPLLRLLASFLTGRSSHARVGNTLSACVRLSGGVPQGAKLSPTLFAIDIDPQVTLVDNAGNDLGVGSDAYADDTDIWIELPGPKSGLADWVGICRKKLQLLQTNVIDESVILAAASKQTFATDPGKFRCVAFIQPDVKAEPILDKLPYLHVEDKAVKIEMTIDGEDDRTLGVTLDSRLNFFDHIKRVAEAARKRLVVLKRLKAAPWYADKEASLVNVYRPWIASLWEHCSPLWGMAHPKFLGMIDEVEKEALAICLGASQIRGRSRVAIIVETNSTSAQIRRLQAAAIFWNKVRNSHKDSLLGQLMSTWKTNPHWQTEVEQALRYSCWADRTTEKNLFPGKTSRLDDESVNGGQAYRHTITRALITPLAFACAAAIKLGLDDSTVGLTEKLGQRTAERRIKPWLQDPLKGVTVAAKSIGDLNSETMKGARTMRDVVADGTEAHSITWPVFGPAGSPDRKTEEANAYASRVQQLGFADARQRNNGSLVCATDGSFVQKWGPSVLQELRGPYTSDLWKREGGGAGCAIFDASMQPLARWGIPLGRVGDSAGAELHAMHAMLVALTRVYLGAQAARRIDSINSPGTTDSPLLPVWEQSSGSGGPPESYRHRRGSELVVVYILCDNQWVVNSTRTECLAAQPYRGGVKQRPGHSILADIVKAKRALRTGGIVVQAIWIPGHTEGSTLNDTADLLADAASLKAATTGKGANQYRTPSKCFKNTVKRRGKLLFRNEFYRLWDRSNRNFADKYMSSTILSFRPTANWLLPEELRKLGENLPRKWRWTQLPKGAITTSKSRSMEKCVSCLRLHAPTHASIKAWMEGLATPQCPWCHEVKDSARHRFECKSLDQLRRSLVPHLRRALALEGEDGMGMDITNEEILDNYWSWDVLVAGKYSELKWLELERFTTPPEQVYMGLTKVLHTFLRRSRFFYAVFLGSAGGAYKNGEREEEGDADFKEIKELLAPLKAGDYYFHVYAWVPTADSTPTETYYEIDHYQPRRVSARLHMEQRMVGIDSGSERDGEDSDQDGDQDERKSEGDNWSKEEENDSDQANREYVDAYGRKWSLSPTDDEDAPRIVPPEAVRPGDNTAHMRMWANQVARTARMLQKQQAVASAISQMTTTECKHCGKVTPIDGLSQDTGYCSKLCANRWEEGWKDGSKTAMDPRGEGGCDQCGKENETKDTEFAKQPGEAYFNLCSSKCALHHRKEELAQLVPTMFREPAKEAATRDIRRAARESAMDKPGAEVVPPRGAAHFEKEMYTVYKAIQQREAEKGNAVAWIERRADRIIAKNRR
jgi:hypothetical protein